MKKAASCKNGDYMPASNGYDCSNIPNHEISKESMESLWKDLLDTFSDFLNSFLKCSELFPVSRFSKCELSGGGMQLWCLQQRVSSILKGLYMNIISFFNK